MLVGYVVRMKIIFFFSVAPLTTNGEAGDTKEKIPRQK
jgi:hypothetical protein